MWNGTGNGSEDGYGAQDQVSGYCDKPPGSTQNQCIGNITDYAGVYLQCKRNHHAPLTKNTQTPILTRST